MMHRIVRCLLGATVLAFATATGAEELTVNSLLMARNAGATTDGLVAVVRNPANTIGMVSGDLATLRAAGLPEAVITAIGARIVTPAPSPAALRPDDARLVDLVSLIKSGISESIIAEQVRQSRPPYNLSVTDLLYLKQNGVLESIIGALMATTPGGQPASGAGAAAPAAPQEMTFQDLVLTGSWMRKDRPGRLTIRDDTLAWADGADPEKNFEFQIAGLEKVWFTCQARTPENFCYQINFDIVKGAHYRFQDVNQESGSNTSVLKVMEALRMYFPQVSFGPPDA